MFPWMTYAQPNVGPAIFSISPSPRLMYVSPPTMCSVWLSITMQAYG